MTPHTAISEVFRLSLAHMQGLDSLGIATVFDLLYHFPTRYGDVAQVRSVASLQVGERATIFGRIKNLEAKRAFYKKIPMATAELYDETGRIKLIWFNQPYIAKMLPEECLVRAEGKVSERKGILFMSNPNIERVESVPIGVGESLFGSAGADHHLYPVYPESRGVTSNWLYHAVQKVLSAGVLEELSDPIPLETLKRYRLPSLKTALIWLHAPKRRDDALAARKRFAFEEVFLIQLHRQRERLEIEKSRAAVIEVKNEVEKFLARFPFEPTKAQRRAIEAILEDLRKGVPMSRLLEGDVGSGKTLVAAAVACAVATRRPLGQRFRNLQVAYMAPTEILATQHFESFAEYFAGTGVQIGLITGSGCRKFPSKVKPRTWTKISRPQLLRWVEGGEIPILIGTHALIEKEVAFKHLTLVIIDEQHRFGVRQRFALARKSTQIKTQIDADEKFATARSKYSQSSASLPNLSARLIPIPHLLSMTATPIPRTLALTIYGDLDLTLLDEMPPGRHPIITEVVLPRERESTYGKVREAIKAGRQAYVICPRIEEPDPRKAMALQVKSVKAEAKLLKSKVFKEFDIAILHSKMPAAEKEKVMAAFAAGKTQILVATSVVEVGVNVPNATVIIIEGAERFGLAQLHQLRGRVLRSTYQAYCYIFADVESRRGLLRLNALQRSSSGFELAELDLKLRGAGELGGNQQWGLSDIGMEALRNIKMVEAARSEARRLLESDPHLSHFPHLRDWLGERKGIHFE